jgi:hypothetical protein
MFTAMLLLPPPLMVVGEIVHYWFVEVIWTMVGMGLNFLNVLQVQSEK